MIKWKGGFIENDIMGDVKTIGKDMKTFVTSMFETIAKKNTRK